MALREEKKEWREKKREVISWSWEEEAPSDRKKEKGGIGKEKVDPFLSEKKRKVGFQGGDVPTVKKGGKRNKTLSTKLQTGKVKNTHQRKTRRGVG